MVSHRLGVAASAARWPTAWKVAIGRPNCSRPVVYSPVRRTASAHARRHRAQGHGGVLDQPGQGGAGAVERTEHRAGADGDAVQRRQRLGRARWWCPGAAGRGRAVAGTRNRPTSPAGVAAGTTIVSATRPAGTLVRLPSRPSHRRGGGPRRSAGSGRRAAPPGRRSARWCRRRGPAAGPPAGPGSPTGPRAGRRGRGRPGPGPGRPGARPPPGPGTARAPRARRRRARRARRCRAGRRPPWPTTARSKRRSSPCSTARTASGWPCRPAAWRPRRWWPAARRSGRSPLVAPYLLAIGMPMPKAAIRSRCSSFVPPRR